MVKENPTNKEILAHAHDLVKRYNICEMNFSRIRAKIINKDFSTIQELEDAMRQYRKPTSKTLTVIK